MKHIRSILAGAMALCLSLSLVSPALAAGDGVTYTPAKYTRVETDWQGRLSDWGDGWFIATDENGAQGMIDRSGKTVVEFVHESLAWTDRQSYVARKDGQSALIRKDGKALLPYGGKEVSIASSDSNQIVVGEDEQYCFGDLTPGDQRLARTPGLPKAVQEALMKVQGDFDCGYTQDDGPYEVTFYGETPSKGFLDEAGRWIVEPNTYAYRLMEHNGQYYQIQLRLQENGPIQFRSLDPQGKEAIPWSLYPGEEFLLPSGILAGQTMESRDVVDVANHLQIKDFPNNHMLSAYPTASGCVAVTEFSQEGKSTGSSLYKDGAMVKHFDDRMLSTDRNSTLIECQSLALLDQYIFPNSGLMNEKGDLLWPMEYGCSYAGSGFYILSKDNEDILVGRDGQELLRGQGLYQSATSQDGRILLIRSFDNGSGANSYFVDTQTQKILYSLPYECSMPDSKGTFAYMNGEGRYGLGQLPSPLPTAAAKPQPKPEPQPEKDQPSGWAKGFVEQAVKANLVPQDLQSKYTQATTRAEFCALAVQLYETATGTQVTGRVEFPDSADVNIQKAAYLGVISGIEEGGVLKAKPGDTLTREQAAIMLCGLAKACDQPLAQGQADFTDVSDGKWSRGFIGQVQKAGIMSGVEGGRFDADGSYTREMSILTMLKLFGVVQ